LKKSGVKNELIIVPGAPHYGAMFDSPENWAQIQIFLNKYMQ